MRAAALLALCAVCTAAAPDADRPNIVVILADDLGYGDLSSYGAADLKSPNVDAIGRAGVTLARAYANCPVCSPTRASLLTGRYPELVGVPGVIRTHPRDNWGWMAPSAVTLPQVLGKAGYHTAIVGKWHLGLEEPNTPNGRGFDFFHGFLGDMMDDYYKHRRHGINYMYRDREKIDPPGHATDLFTDWACDYLRGRAGKDRPFFLYLAYNAPHTPIQPPAEWVARVKAREAGITDRRAKLVALIEHMDAGIGKVVRTLEETGLSKNTLLIFTSDNGGQLNVGGNNGGLRDGKQSMYEGGIRVPFVASWPGKIAPGSSADVDTLTMDLYPTLCEAAGAKFDHEIDGVSILPALLGGDERPPERDLYWIRREGNARYMGLTIHAVRSGDWKLVKNSPMGPFELYNLKEDPKEATDLAAKQKGIYNRLAAKLRAQLQKGGAVPWQKP